VEEQLPVDPPGAVVGLPQLPWRGAVHEPAEVVTAAASSRAIASGVTGVMGLAELGGLPAQRMPRAWKAAVTALEADEP